MTLAACDRDWIVLDVAFAREALWTCEEHNAIRNVLILLPLAAAP